MPPARRPREPSTRITISGDGHYGCPEVMDWCEANGIDYRRSSSTRRSSTVLPGRPKTSWKKQCRACDRIEVSTQDLDIRFVVTSLTAGSAEHVYNVLYCARGQAENLIKMQKSQLASDLTSCRSPLANHVRLSLHTVAYWLILRLRDAIPKTHALAKAEFATIRLRLLKLVARVIETTSRVRLAFAAACPDALPPNPSPKTSRRVDRIKKKELVGDFKNNGRAWRPAGNPEEVRVHEFLIKELERAIPYGIFDLAANDGRVSIGLDHYTAAFAVQSIRRWWQEIGSTRYPHATRLVITAEGGGSNGSRVRLWKCELQRLADELGIDFEVHHLPPGNIKWNKIEHRLFSFISMNWRAKLLVSYRVIVNLISATTTKTGLTVRGELDTASYPKGVPLRRRNGRHQHHVRRHPRRRNYIISPTYRPDRAINF